MYKSVIRDGKFIVLVTDGVFDNSLMELPTEELADKVAYELQTAWDEGIEWGANQKQRELLGNMGDEEVSKIFQKMRIMTTEEREGYQQRLKRRYERIQKVVEAHRWKSVLSLKNHDI